MTDGSARRSADPAGARPEVSLVMPCYNEAGCIGETARELVETFLADGVALELVLVDNGSTDGTGAIIDGLVEEGLPIRKIRVDVNRGYGDGVLRGLEACEAPVLGFLCADGQVAAPDVLRTLRLMEGREERVVAKVRRRFREDSLKRKVVSIVYNGLMQVTFGWLGAIDINGNPKLFSRRNFQMMDLQSRDWFLDPEIILKARVMGLRVIEVDVEGRSRRSGFSHVRRSTILQFLANIWRYRTGSYLRRWKRGLQKREGGANGRSRARDGRAIPGGPGSSEAESRPPARRRRAGISITEER